MNLKDGVLPFSMKAANTCGRYRSARSDRDRFVMLNSLALCRWVARL
jgi:hypothetical protein